jgi:hypothetical protein
MASRFIPVKDEQIFVPNEAAILPNTKKATKWMYSSKLFLINKITKSYE